MNKLHVDYIELFDILKLGRKTLMNIYFSKAVVDALFLYKCGLVSWRFHPLKLTKEYTLLLKHALVVIKGNYSTIKNQKKECHQIFKRVEKCDKVQKGVKSIMWGQQTVHTWFCSKLKLMFSGLQDIYILPCCTFGAVSW